MSDFSVSGLEDAIRKTRAIAKSLEKVDVEVILGSLEDMATYAREIVPVRTGRLRDSIEVSATAWGWSLGASAPYASYVEFGTSRQAAQPYLAPAVLAILAEMDGRLEDAFNDFVGSA